MVKLKSAINDTVTIDATPYELVNITPVPGGTEIPSVAKLNVPEVYVSKLKSTEGVTTVLDTALDDVFVTATFETGIGDGIGVGTGGGGAGVGCTGGSSTVDA